MLPCRSHTWPFFPVEKKLSLSCVRFISSRPLHTTDMRLAAPVLPSIGAYLLGLSFYANQFPECTSPGRWDTFFASHQLWHSMSFPLLRASLSLTHVTTAAIVLAVWTHWRAMNIWAGTAVAGRLGCLASSL